MIHEMFVFCYSFLSQKPGRSSVGRQRSCRRAFRRTRTAGEDADKWDKDHREIREDVAGDIRHATIQFGRMVFSILKYHPINAGQIRMKHEKGAFFGSSHVWSSWQEIMKYTRVPQGC